MGMTVRQLLASMTSIELSRWMAFYEMEPFGIQADMYGHGIVASTIANVHRKKGSKAYPASDFVPTFERKKPQSTAEMIGMAAHITQAMGGKDKRE